MRLNIVSEQSKHDLVRDLNFLEVQLRGCSRCSEYIRHFWFDGFRRGICGDYLC
jgi:hypothetical protein